MRRKTFKNRKAVAAAALLGTAVLAGCQGSQTAQTDESNTEAESQQQTEASSEDVKEEKKTELVIAGGDGAGLVAAIQAAAEGLDPASIRIIAPGSTLGEDMENMAPYVNAYNTQEQFDEGIEDDFEIYLADTVAAGENTGRQEMASYLVENGEMAVDWIRETLGIELGSISQQEGSSVARSYPAAEGNLNEKVRSAMTDKIEELGIEVTYNAEVTKAAYNEEGILESVTIVTEDGEETLPCTALVATDLALLPVFENSQVYENAEGPAALIVSDCAEQLDESGELIPGLYAAGPVIEAAVHGNKALAGNELTSMIVYGITAGTESSIYISDSQ